MSLKCKLQNKELTFGSWITIGHPSIAEILAYSGFEWLTIDMEHSAITLSEAQNLIQVIELAGVIPLVRVSSDNPNLIKRVMDAGAHGVIVPQVNTAKQAHAVVKSVKYPPVGERGVGLGRAQGYGLHFEGYKYWNAHDSVVIVQIENILGVQNVEEIISVEGVDGFIVGPYDLSASLGIPGEFENEEYLDVIRYLHSVITKEKTISAGFHVVPLDPNQVHEKIAEGYTFIAYSLDSLFLAEYSRKDLNIIKKESKVFDKYIKRSKI